MFIGVLMFIILVCTLHWLWVPRPHGISDWGGSPRGSHKWTVGAQHQRLRALFFGWNYQHFTAKDILFRRCSEISLYLYKNPRSIGLIFLWKSVLIFENFSRFSREPPGLPLSDFWEPSGGCRVLWTPGHLDLVRPGPYKGTIAWTF